MIGNRKQNPPFRIEWADRVDSTNAVLRLRLGTDANLPAGLVLAARDQFAGRGRGTRTWTAPAGANLTFSILLRAGVPLTQLLSLPMAAALATSDLLAARGIVATLKWPNDVRVGERKISGVLLENAGTATILGIGLNVNMTRADLAGIDQPATSLLIESGRGEDLHALLEEWLVCFAVRHVDWHRYGFAGLLTDWETRAQAVGTVTPRGRIAGYGPEGQLLVERGGSVVELWDAE